MVMGGLGKRNCDRNASSQLPQGKLYDNNITSTDRPSGDTSTKSTNTASCLSDLTMASFNVRSINNKSAAISDLISEYHLDVLALQETWHENTDSLSLRCAVPPGYCVVDAARNGKTDNAEMRMNSAGGGVAIIYREQYKCHKVVSLPSVKSFEFVCCRLTTTARYEFTVLSIYRPGSHAVTNEFINDFTVLMEALATFTCPIFILGDINIHLERPDDTHTVEMVELLESFDMNQFVTENTHKYGGRLDVIIARRDEVVRDIEVVETGVSDHSMLVCRHPIPIISTDFAPSEGRKWNEFSIDAFRNDLVETILCCADDEWLKSVSTDDLFQIYHDELLKLIDKHAPRYTRKRKSRILSPWFDDECRMIKRSARRLERKYRKSGLPTDRLAWVLKLKEKAAFYQHKECAYWSSRIKENASQPKRLWQDLDVLMRRVDDAAPTTSQDDCSKRAQEFSDFFEKKVSNIRAATEHAADPTFLDPSTDQLFEKFINITPELIIKLISSASNKYCPLDPIPTSIVKSCKDLLAPFLSDLFNRSLSEGYVPKSQKTAYITPHLKKRGLDKNENKNYRPVSNLSFLSKLLEKTVACQLIDFLERTNALPLLQSAYRKYFSTETALLKVFSDLCRAIDDGNVCLIGLLDLSAAFDTVDHDILISRLNLTFNIKSQTLQWFKSYLSDRTQSVRVSSSSSSTSYLNYGIPQGSILGPLLFVLYASPIEEIVRKHGLWSHCYADDTQLYFYCAPDQMDGLIISFTDCIVELEDWMAANKLKLNTEKTEFVWVASRSRFQNIQNHTRCVNVGNAVISSSSGSRNLGVYFDQHLDMKQHILNVCRQSFFQLRQLRVICRSLPKDILKILLHSFVFSRLDYCNSLLYGLPKCYLKKLQSVENAAARLYSGRRKYDHITPLLRDELHWLPISARIDYKIAVLTYKALHNQAPKYLTDMCSLASEITGLSRNRSATNGKLVPTSWNTVGYGKRCFNYAAPEVWNKLPVSLIQNNCFNDFKKHLKTVLFIDAYSHTN